MIDVDDANLQAAISAAWVAGWGMRDFPAIRAALGNVGDRDLSDGVIHQTALNMGKTVNAVVPCGA